jgi:hypothetical protein
LRRAFFGGVVAIAPFVGRHAVDVYLFVRSSIGRVVDCCCSFRYRYRYRFVDAGMRAAKAQQRHRRARCRIFASLPYVFSLFLNIGIVRLYRSRRCGGQVQFLMIDDQCLMMMVMMMECRCMAKLTTLGMLKPPRVRQGISDRLCILYDSLCSQQHTVVREPMIQR